VFGVNLFGLIKAKIENSLKLIPIVARNRVR